MYYQVNDYKNAELYSKEALQLANESNFLIIKIESSKVLYNTYIKTGQAKQALEMHELYNNSRDSLLSEKNQKEVINQQLKYEYEKKSLADSLVFVNKKKIDDLKHEAELKVEQNQRYALYGGLSLVIIF